ncbi:hypothetical protein CDAR_238531 [Caerostris darwini]|uniref:Transmembrane protein n=1 Tax=Caerostris darwini TaxID=1538125 RepID=A0AAV4W411_9ARAC|nr:hypothetical protein CDAR_238531 [Caerostris darwini]
MISLKVEMNSKSRSKETNEKENSSMLGHEVRSSLRAQKLRETNPCEIDAADNQRMSPPFSVFLVVGHLMPRLAVGIYYRTKHLDEKKKVDITMSI